ncbi:MAG: uroporphyrinogen decarboxylase [Dongiaceae bacterium]
MTKRLIETLGGSTAMPPPIWLMRQAGRYLPEYRALRGKAGDFLSLCFDPELAIEVTLQPVERFGLDAAILFSDILVVPYAMGQGLRFEEGIGPLLEPIRDPTRLRGLETHRIVERLAPVMATVRGVAARLPEQVALIGFAGAPWTVAAYMIEGRGGGTFTTPLAMAKEGDPVLAGVIERLVDASVDYLLAQIDAGAEIVQLFDSWAGILPSGLRRRWSIEPLVEIVDRLRARAPQVPIVVFPRQVGHDALAYLEAIRPDAIGLDQSADLAFARTRLQPHVALQGNLDPLLLVEGGAALAAGVDEIMQHLSGGPFVFNLGHGVVPETPPDHVAQLVALVRDWRPH